MRTLRLLLGAGVTLAMLGCELPAPTLATIINPTLSLQRSKGGALQMLLNYDTARSACGEIANFKVTLDGEDVPASGGAFNKDAKDEDLRCTFPNFLTNPTMKSTPRTLVLTDDTSTYTMVIDSLDLGSALPSSPPPTLYAGDTVRWLTTLPAQGTTSWKATYTPNGGNEVVWLDGTQLPENVVTTVPAVNQSTQGPVALSWLMNATVTRCEGPSACNLTLQGYAQFVSVVNPKP